MWRCSGGIRVDIWPRSLIFFRGGAEEKYSGPRPNIHPYTPGRSSYNEFITKKSFSPQFNYVFIKANRSTMCCPLSTRNLVPFHPKLPILGECALWPDSRKQASAVAGHLPCFTTLTTAYEATEGKSIHTVRWFINIFILFHFACNCFLHLRVIYSST